MEEEFNLYTLLNVNKESSSQEIKKQYKKLALAMHPDKNQDNPSAKENFQRINEAYQILIDEEKRKIYDSTGLISGHNNINDFHNAYVFFRNIYKKIELKDIEEFEQKYRKSKEEEEDLLDFYNNSKGDMTELLMNIPCSYNTDVTRFIEFYDQMIQKKIIKSYSKFNKTKGKVALLKDESQEIIEMEKEKNQQYGKSIVSIIQNKSSHFDHFINQLETKYLIKKKKNEYDIDDEHFNQIQANIIKKKKKQNK